MCYSLSLSSEGYPKITSNGKSFHYQAQKRAAEEAENGRKKKSKALQGQLAALKEMQAGVQVGRGSLSPPVLLVEIL